MHGARRQDRHAKISTVIVFQDHPTFIVQHGCQIWRVVYPLATGARGTEIKPSTQKMKPTTAP